MKSGISTFSYLPERHLRILDKREQPYQDYSAMEQDGHCVQCGAVYREGAWRWMKPSMDAIETCCPACRRMEEQAPAAHLEIETSVSDQKMEELLGAINDLELTEKAADPLQRIISIEPSKKGWLVTTTDVRLARAIAQFPQNSYRCGLDFHYDRERSLLWLHCSA